MKNIKLIITIILSIIISIPISLIIEFNVFSWSNILKLNIFLLLLISIFIFYIFSHFIYKIKDIYNFIYKRRYLISLIILIILVLGKFNGSSLGIWNNIVEPNNSINTTIIGTNKEIRSDEWSVNTPYAVSQKYNDYKYYSDLPRGTSTDMFTTIFVPIKDILVITRPFNIGYLVLGEEYGLSFYWYGRLIVLLLVSFEFMMLLSNKKKLLSLAGAILITGSPLVSWFYSNYIVDLLISGQLTLLIFNKYLETKNNKLKILYSILIGLTFSWFTLTIYPAWQISLGYVYFVFALYILTKNIKNNKSIKDYLYLLISILITGIFILRFYMLSKDTLDILLNTVYPGNRIISDKGIFINHFIYPISIFFGLFDYHNPCEVSGVYSLFPIPIIISIIYLIKNKEKNNTNTLILLLTVLSIIFILYTFFPMPKILSKLTFLSMVPKERVVPIIGLICAYLLVLTVSKIDIKKNTSKIIILFITIVVSYIIIKIGALDRLWYLTPKRLIFSLIILSLTIYLYINSKNKRNEFILSILLIVIGLTNIILVNPVNVGTSVLHEKNSSKEIQKLSNNNTKWLALNSIYLGNYVLSNGGKVINSTNIYPNLELWNKLDKNNQYKDIYNRYAHIKINLVEEETSFSLVQSDYIEVNINYSDLDNLNINYIIIDKELDIPDIIKNRFKLISNYDNIYIYKYL